jgi:hypothetical protein
MPNTLHRRNALPALARIPLGLLLCAGLSACASPSGNTAYAPERAVSVREGKTAPVPGIPMGDASTIARILDEGKHRNQVMDHLRHLTQKIGPRLTGSSNAEKANYWTLDKFRSWGLNADLFKWGEIATRFDRGPCTGKLYTKRTTKKEGGASEETWTSVRDLEFTTLAWTRGTDGPKRGPVVVMPDSDEEYAKVKASLKGAWVLLEPVSVEGRGGVRGPGQRAGDRFTARKEARDKVAKGESPAKLPLEDRVLFDGILGFISSSTDQRDRVWTTGTPKPLERKLDDIGPDVEVIVRLCDHDNIVVRMHEKQEFQVEFDLPHTLTPGPIPVYDTIAEIKGSEKPDEVVVVCGHLDSWNGPGSQGCTDNGTGSMVALESARILMAAHARPKRTIRFILWTGEEQGLLGSKAYIKSLSPEELAKISVCLNDDGGTNYEGGIKCTADMADYLAAATAPTNNQFTDAMDGKPLNCNIQVVEKFIRGGSSDHASFTEAGVPGFFYDEVGRADYGYGWHTQHDRYDLAVREYLEQSSTNQAITAYNMACAPDLLPRVPPPAPGEAPAPRPRRNRDAPAPTTPSPGATPAPTGKS